MKDQKFDFVFVLNIFTICYIYIFKDAGYMASDMRLRTIQITREETVTAMVYSFLLAARVLFYALSHRQDSTYHGLCYISSGALAGMGNSSMDPPWDRSDGLSQHEWILYHGSTSRSV